jgi:hypothetical protein
MVERHECPRCDGNGLLLDDINRAWEECFCAAGRRLTDELNQAEADIRGGHSYRWEDVRHG